MKKLVVASALAAALLALAGAAYGRQTATPIVPSVTVNTATGTLLTLKTSELAVLPQQTLTVPINGTPTIEQGSSATARRSSRSARTGNS